MLPLSQALIALRAHMRDAFKPVLTHVRSAAEGPDASPRTHTVKRGAVRHSHSLLRKPRLGRRQAVGLPSTHRRTRAEANARRQAALALIPNGSRSGDRN